MKLHGASKRGKNQTFFPTHNSLTGTNAYRKIRSDQIRSGISKLIHHKGANFNAKIKREEKKRPDNRFLDYKQSPRQSKGRPDSERSLLGFSGQFMNAL